MMGGSLPIWLAGVCCFQPLVVSQSLRLSPSKSISVAFRGGKNLVGSSCYERVRESLTAYVFSAHEIRLFFSSFDCFGRCLVL
jgi:hypothetical protein